MEGLEKDHPYSESSQQQPPPASEEYSVPDVIITRRLRDRDLLRKRKAEAQEKDTVQWVLGERRKSTRPKRGRGAGRGRGQQQVTKPEPEPEPEPEVLEETEKESEEKAPASPEHQEQLPMSATQELSASTQEEVERTPTEEILHPAEPEEATQAEEAGISEALNIPLENDHIDNEYFPSVLF